jgi:hypothetical protein
MLAVTGMALLAGLAFGASPAMASSSTSSATTTAKTSTYYHGGDDVVGIYRSRMACYNAGERGENRGEWDSYDCDPIGGRRFALTVDDDNYWDGGGYGYGGHGYGGYGYGGYGYGGHWGNHGGGFWGPHRPHRPNGPMQF